MGQPLNTGFRNEQPHGDHGFDDALRQIPDEGDETDLGAGNDTVVLDADDTLTTGAGEDLISFSDWSEDGGPAEILDFNPAEDLLVYTYEAGTQAPALALSHDPETGATELHVDGRLAARIYDMGRALSADEIPLVSYV